MTSCSALSRLCTWHVQTIGIATSYPVGLGNSAIGDILLLHVCIFQLSTLFSLAGRPIPVERKSLACLIGMEYRIIILIIMISLGQIFYHILQTHHACAYTYVRTACTHSRIHVCAHRLRMHAFRHVRTHTCKHTHSRCHRPPHRLSLFGVS